MVLSGGMDESIDVWFFDVLRSILTTKGGGDISLSVAEELIPHIRKVWQFESPNVYEFDKEEAYDVLKYLLLFLLVLRHDNLTHNRP